MFSFHHAWFKHGVKDRIIEDRGKTGAKGGFEVTNEDGSLVGPWNAMAP